MLLVPHVLVGLLQILQLKHLLVNNRLNVVGLDGVNHVLHLQPVANQDTADCADVVQGLKESRLVLVHATNEANDGDNTVNSDGLEGLRHCCRSTDFDNVLDTDTTSDLLGLLAPVGCLLVVDDVIRAVLLEGLSLRGRGCGCNDACASGLGELECKDRDTTSTLCEDPLSRLQRPAFQAVQRIPCCQTSARKCGCLKVVQVLGCCDQTLLVEDTILAECTVDGTAEAGCQGGSVERTGDVGLVEERNDAVAGLESCNAAADGYNLTGAV